MKYRIVRTAKRVTPAPSRREFQLCASQTLSRMAAHHEETIDLSRLFEISDLPALRKKKTTSRFWIAIRIFFVAFFSRLSGLIRRSSARLREKANLFRMRMQARRKRKKPETLYLLSGAFLSSLCVSILCVAIVLISLLGSYGGIYRTVSVPALVGLPYEESEYEDDRFLFLVDYQYNPDVTPGIVISQSPPAGVTRRIYGRGKPCTVTLTVSVARNAYLLADLVGRSRRDALLELRNHGIACEIREDYSDTAPVGTVLSQSVAPNTPLSEASTVTLTFSRGPMLIGSAVPSLVGLSEMEASSLLLSAGLSVGRVTYVPSDRPAGTVLSQDTPPASTIKQGSVISFTVSAGYSYAQKGIPSLYGLTLNEATVRLKEFGLVIGSITQVGNGASGGTVVAQFPLPDTPITPSTVSVDLYLGS